VADLIAAQSKAEKDLALTQLRGGISQELAKLRERLLTFTSLVELELDFADHEELEFANRTQLEELADEIDQKISNLTHSFKTGNAIKNGLPVAIIGAPNVGKSTLLNALLGEERAIVSDIQGTTRDTIEDTLVLGGMLFRFIDTAGMRLTEDTIENMGIERSRQAAQRATIIIHLVDATQPIDILREIDNIDDKLVLTVYNKVDLLPTFSPSDGIIGISAKQGNIEVITNKLVAYASEQLNTHNAITISNTRHYESLSKALDAIHRVKDGLQMQISGEFLSMDLQDCLTALGEITGHITSQEVLNNIFSKFCIGK
jgi:tRNA modification GTPase